MTDRVLALKDRALRCHQPGDAEAGALFQESLSQTEGEPEVIRQAKYVAHYFRRQQVTIYDGELLVGSRPGQTTQDEVITPQVFGRRDWNPPNPEYWPTPAATHAFWREGMFGAAGNHTTVDYTTIPAPPRQPNMPKAATAPARPATDMPPAVNPGTAALPKG